jgi:ribonuclease P protein component
MNFHPFFVCALAKKRALRAVHPSEQLPHARLGVVVAKRFAPRAVTRNTIKRVTRELFRVTGLPPSIAWCAWPAGQQQGWTCHHCKAESGLRVELARLFAAQAKLSGKPALPPSSPPPPRSP